MRIKLTSIMVDDQEKALNFYTEVLGFQKKQDIPMGEFRWLTVVSTEEPDGSELALEPDVNPDAKKFKTAMFQQGIPFVAIEVNDVDIEYKRLTDLGVEFKSQPVDIGGGQKMVLLKDTCGNFVQLYNV